VKESISTFLQIDLQNLYAPKENDKESSSFRDTGRDYRDREKERRKKLDFEKIYEYFNDRETEYLTGACIYSIKSPEFDSSNFETKIKVIGFEMKSKSISSPPKNFRNSYTPAPKISFAVQIAIDCISKMNRFEKLILMSNNTIGLYDLCKFLKDNGKKIELWCFNYNYDPILEPLVDRHFIDDDFCMQKPNISVFGANSGPVDFELDSTATLRVF